MPPSVQWLCVDGIGPEGQAVLLGRVAEVVEHACPAATRASSPLGVDLEDVVQILGEVHDDRDVAALPARLVPPPRREDGAPMRAAGRDRRDDVVDRRAG